MAVTKGCPEVLCEGSTGMIVNMLANSSQSLNVKLGQVELEPR